MELSPPLYCCLTDGSGGESHPRLDSTTALLDRLGAERGPIFGRFPDKALYQLILDGAADTLAALANELADYLVERNVTEVVGDAVEGFNPVHDVCRFVIDGGVNIAQQRTGRTIANYDFILDGKPDDCPEPLRSRVRRVLLDDEALERKVNAALAMPELRHEVEIALERFGRRAFAVESLRPSATEFMIARFERQLPLYEQYGQMRVNQGRYDRVILYREHVLPVRHAIAGVVEA